MEPKTAVAGTNMINWNIDIWRKTDSTNTVEDARNSHCWKQLIYILQGKGAISNNNEETSENSNTNLIG